MALKYVPREITYLDSNILSEQTDEVVEPCTIKAIGYVIKETRQYITIARELIDDEYRGQVSIPKVAIIDQRQRLKQELELEGSE